MRGATITGKPFREMFGISIHAPHAGRDVQQLIEDYRRNRISIHAPHAGRDGITV